MMPSNIPVAFSHGLPVVTADGKHSPVSGLGIVIFSVRLKRPCVE